MVAGKGADENQDEDGRRTSHIIYMYIVYVFFRCVEGFRQSRALVTFQETY